MAIVKKAKRLLDKLQNHAGQDLSYDLWPDEVWTLVHYIESLEAQVDSEAPAKYAALAESVTSLCESVQTLKHQADELLEETRK